VGNWKCIGPENGLLEVQEGESGDGDREIARLAPVAALMAVRRDCWTVRRARNFTPAGGRATGKDFPQEVPGRAFRRGGAGGASSPFE
jgi:hypothetical protein